MATRVDDARFRAAAPPRTRAASRTNISAGQRILFVVALVTFGMASIYTAIALLARVTPALFPGKELSIPGLSPVLESLPGAAKVEPAGATSVFNKRINVLVIGVDKRPGFRDEDAFNTDTLMVATFDPVSKQASVLGFPRDMWIQIHPINGGQPYYDRINASYAAGFLAGDHTFDAGAQQLMNDIKLNFGIETDYWVWLDFKGVEKMIDDIGGIDVEIPDDLGVYDWWYTDDDMTNPHNVTFAPGLQHLNGYNAVAFGRNRDPSDMSRIKRQQLVLKTAIAKVFSRGLLDDPIGLYNAYTSIVHTNMPKTRVAGLAPTAKEAASKPILMYSLGDPVNNVPTVEGWMTPGGASVLLWDKENVQYWLSQVFTKSQYSQSNVEVQNGYGEAGDVRATGLGRYLKYSKGLPSVDIGPDVAVQPLTTITLLDEEKRPLAEDMAKWLGIPADKILKGTKTDVTQPDVVVIIGKDFKLPGT